MNKASRPAVRAALALGALAALATAPHAVQAQSSNGNASTSPPAATAALLRDIAGLEQKLVALAEAMPEASYDWRPGQGVRSVGEVVMHVAADNYFLPVFAGVDAPAATGIKPGDYPSVQAYEQRKATKAEAIQALRDSFVHLRAAMEGTDEAFLGRTADLFGNQMSGLDLWVMTATHLHEHLGQSIAYARSNGVVPPWSQ